MGTPPDRGLPRRVVFAEDAVGRFGGVETLLRTLSPLLQEHGIRVEFLSHERPSGPPPVPGRIHWYAVDPAEGPWRAAWRRRRRRFFFRGPGVLTWLAGGRLSMGLGPRDALVMMNETVAADLLPDLAARRSRDAARGRPGPFTALEFHSRFRSAWRERGDAILRRAAEQSDAFIALDPREARLFAAHYGRVVASIPNPVALPLAAAPRSSRPTELVCVARLSPEKRVDWVLRAFDAAAGDLPEWRLSVCGSGPEAPALEELRRSLPHGDRIRLLGERTPAQLLQAYDGAGLLALASRFEGTPMVLAEAIARGVPLICTPSSEAVGMLADQAGWLSEDSLDSFTATLRTAMTSTEADWRERSAAGLRIAGTHDTVHVVRQWLTLLGTRDPRTIAHAEP